WLAWAMKSVLYKQIILAWVTGSCAFNWLCVNNTGTVIQYMGNTFCGIVDIYWYISTTGFENTEPIFLPFPVYTIF
ncbi:hypothetical protein PN36_32525, partial [Candidatus Thiomargarita nelsonii]